MKVLNMPVDMVAIFDLNNDYPIPLKFRIKSKDLNKHIKIDKIRDSRQEMKAGHRICIFRCESYDKDKDMIIPYEIHYEREDDVWLLYKI